MNPETLKRIAALDMPAESLRELLVILADSAPAKEAMPRAERNRRYYEKSRERLNSDSERLNSDDLRRINSDVSDALKPSPPLPPPPLSPTPPIPAPAHTPTPEGTRGARIREEAADFAAACAHTLDMTASPKLRQAWAEWQVYRQQLHRQTGAGRKLWTLQAARLSANLIASNAEQHGEQIVTDRITAAIAGNWQGLNFDKLTPAPNANHTRRQAQVTRNTTALPSAASLNATSYKAPQHNGIQDDE